jgi:hypothetical protein
MVLAHHAVADRSYLARLRREREKAGQHARSFVLYGGFMLHAQLCAHEDRCALRGPPLPTTYMGTVTYATSR